jgi:hypothetical protein
MKNYKQFTPEELEEAKFNCILGCKEEVRQHDLRKQRSRAEELDYFTYIEYYERFSPWKKELFYVRSKKDIKYIDFSFREYASEVLHYDSFTKYKNMKACSDDLGAEFGSKYIEFGWDTGLATYQNQSLDVKAEIRMAWAAGDTRQVLKIVHELHPPYSRKIVSIEQALIKKHAYELDEKDILIARIRGERDEARAQIAQMLKIGLQSEAV